MTDAAATAPRPEERRVVTILAADVVGSTALAEALDPEEARVIIGDTVRRVITAVETYGGTFKDLAGDGVLALFGAPIAHEDDPERAVRAAIDALAAVGSYAEEVERGWGVPGFGIRAGIATGEVVVGEVGGGARRCRPPGLFPSGRPARREGCLPGHPAGVRPVGGRRTALGARVLDLGLALDARVLDLGLALDKLRRRGGG